MAKIKVSEGSFTFEIETDDQAECFAALQILTLWLQAEDAYKTDTLGPPPDGPSQTLHRLTVEERQREYLRKVEPTEEHREEARRVLAVYIEEKAKGENAYSAWIKNIEEGVATSIARQEHGAKYQVPGTAEDAETIES